jgi:hypothetical protein
MKNNDSQSSAFYKRNTTIHNNLWKIYTASLVLALAFVSIKGLV